MHINIDDSCGKAFEDLCSECMSMYLKEGPGSKYGCAEIGRHYNG